MKPRHPVTPEGAIARIRGLLGVAAAEAIGVSDSHLYKLGDPDQPETVNFKQIVKLDLAYIAAGGEVAPLTDVLVKQVAAGRASMPHRPAALSARVVSIMREIGELSAAVESADKDGVLKHGEAIDLQKEIADAIELLTKMSRDVDALLNGSGKISERGGE